MHDIAVLHLIGLAFDAKQSLLFCAQFAVAADVVGAALNDVLEQGKDISAALEEAQGKLKKRVRK